MRDSLASASERIGIPATLSDRASLAAAATAGLPILEEIARTCGSEHAVVGGLVWSDAALVPSRAGAIRLHQMQDRFL
jgi:hypothetical protein